MGYRLYGYSIGERPALFTLSLKTLVALSLLPAFAQANPVPATRPAAPPAMAAPSVPAAPSADGPIDRAKCEDMAADEAKLKTAIVSKILEAKKMGASPALQYGSDAPAGADRSGLIDSRARSDAASLSHALFAALQSKTDPADAASQEFTAKSNRRMALKIQARCKSSAKPSVLIENQNLYQGNMSCPGGEDPAEIGIDIREVYRTNKPAAQVRVLLAETKASARNTATYSGCFKDLQSCRSSEAYQNANMGQYAPPLNKDYFLERTNTFPFLSMFKGPMKNRLVLKTTPITVCQSTVYLLTRFSVGHDAGFDNTSQLELVARVGNETLVLSSLSQQTHTPDAWPFWSGKYPDRAKTDVYAEYAPVAAALGSTERPAQGDVAEAGGGLPLASNAGHGGGNARASRVTQ